MKREHKTSDERQEEQRQTKETKRTTVQGKNENKIKKNIGEKRKKMYNIPQRGEKNLNIDLDDTDSLHCKKKNCSHAFFF